MNLSKFQTIISFNRHIYINKFSSSKNVFLLKKLEDGNYANKKYFWGINCFSKWKECTTRAETFAEDVYVFTLF